MSWPWGQPGGILCNLMYQSHTCDVPATYGWHEVNSCHTTWPGLCLRCRSIDNCTSLISFVDPGTSLHIPPLTKLCIAHFLCTSRHPRSFLLYINLCIIPSGFHSFLLAQFVHPLVHQFLHCPHSPIDKIVHRSFPLYIPPSSLIPSVHQLVHRPIRFSLAQFVRPLVHQFLHREIVQYFTLPHLVRADSKLSK